MQVIFRLALILKVHYNFIQIDFNKINLNKRGLYVYRKKIRIKCLGKNL